MTSAPEPTSAPDLTSAPTSTDGATTSTAEHDAENSAEHGAGLIEIQCEPIVSVTYLVPNMKRYERHWATFSNERDARLFAAGQGSAKVTP